ncbi:MAG: hypothetical protein ACL7AY_15585 [Candidatus Arsenophonus phytopathogenicus]
MSEIQHTEKKSFQQQVWETLSAINVNEKIERNGSFLSSPGMGVGRINGTLPRILLCH